MLNIDQLTADERQDLRDVLKHLLESLDAYEQVVMDFQDNALVAHNTLVALKTEEREEEPQPVVTPTETVKVEEAELKEVWPEPKPKLERVVRPRKPGKPSKEELAVDDWIGGDPRPQHPIHIPTATDMIHLNNPELNRDKIERVLTEIKQEWVKLNEEKKRMMNIE